MMTEDIDVNKVNSLIENLGKAYVQTKDSGRDGTSVKLLFEELEKLREKHKNYANKSEQRIKELNSRIDSLKGSFSQQPTPKPEVNVAASLKTIEQKFNELAASRKYSETEMEAMRRRIDRVKKKLTKENFQGEKVSKRVEETTAPAEDRPGLSKFEQFSKQMLEPDAEPVEPELPEEDVLPNELPKLEPPGPLPSLEVQHPDEADLLPMGETEMLVHPQKKKKARM